MSKTRDTEQIFRREGDYWTIAYEGRLTRLKDARGIRYLAHLLWHPHREFHATELVRLASGVPEVTREAEQGSTIHAGLGDAGEALDARARADYRRRLTELDEELAEAERLRDRDRAGQLQAAIEALAHELSVSQPGRRAVAHAERARLTVTKGIKGALDRIRASHPALGAHLVATVKRGYTCAYMPDPRSEIRWV